MSLMSSHHILLAAMTLCMTGCGGSIDEQIRTGTVETAYYYHSGGIPAGRHVTITVVINRNGGVLKREERTVGNSRENRESIAEFAVTGADLKKLYLLIEEHGFFRLKTKKADNPDSDTVYLKIKKGSALHIREESPVIVMADNSNRQAFMAVIGAFTAFVKERLPRDRKRLVER